jgi:hypothetical protein
MMRKLLFLLLLFAAISFPASCIQNATNVIFSEQGTNIVLVIVIVGMVIALAYMIGSLTSNPRFTVFAKDELYHLGISILLLASFSVIIGSSCSIMGFFYSSTFEKLNVTSCYNPGEDLNTVSNCYIKMVKSDAEFTAQRFLKEYINNQMYSTLSITIQVPFINAQTVSAEAYRKVYSQQYDLVLNSFIIPALLSLNIQKIILEFVSKNVISWILPIAFLFRVFIPTRQMGNFLIALSIGLYIFLPFLYTFNLAMYDISSQDCSKFKLATDDVVFGDGCSTYGFWNVGRFLPQAFFLPNLSIALFITFMSAVNKALRVIG